MDTAWGEVLGTAAKDKATGEGPGPQELADGSPSGTCSSVQGNLLVWGSLVGPGSVSAQSLTSVTLAVRLLLPACHFSAHSKYFRRNMLLRAADTNVGVSEHGFRGESFPSCEKESGEAAWKAGRAITPHAGLTPREGREWGWVPESQTATQAKEGSARPWWERGPRAKAGSQRGPGLPEVACPSVMGQKQPGLRAEVISEGGS